MTASPIYLRPIGILGGMAARHALAEGAARPLAGGPLAFAACEVIERERDGRYVHSFDVTDLQSCRLRGDAALSETVERGLAAMASPRPPFAGLALDRPRLMGVVNVTPDSFSDGGRFAGRDAAIAQGQALLAAGADIVDIGGESTRPGAQPVSPQQEIDRAVPVVAALARQGALVSIDTRRAAVMQAALAEGARIINDVTALAGDPQSLAVAAASGAAVVLMHMQGEPSTMQKDPRYRDAPLDIHDFFAERLAACEQAGLPRARIALDPGIGFGKNDAHNLAILDDLALFHDLGCGLLLGASRKSFIGRLSRREDAGHRLPGTIAATLAGVARGVQIHRVHDVAEVAQALAVWQAIGAPPA